MADVREWSCKDCEMEWVALDVEYTPIVCPFCESQKPPRDGGLKPIRPNPGG